MIQKKQARLEILNDYDDDLIGYQNGTKFFYKEY